MLVYAVVDDSPSPTFPLGDSLEVYVWREDAERFMEEVRRDEPELAESLRIEERELEEVAEVRMGGRDDNPLPEHLAAAGGVEQVGSRQCD